MALSNKKKRAIGDFLVDNLHLLNEFFEEKIEYTNSLRELKETDEKDVQEYILKLAKKIPNNQY